MTNYLCTSAINYNNINLPTCYIRTHYVKRITLGVVFRMQYKITYASNLKALNSSRNRRPTDAFFFFSWQVFPREHSFFFLLTKKCINIDLIYLHRCNNNCFTIFKKSVFVDKLNQTVFVKSEILFSDYIGGGAVLVSAVDLKWKSLASTAI